MLHVNFFPPTNDFPKESSTKDISSEEKEGGRSYKGGLVHTYINQYGKMRRQGQKKYIHIETRLKQILSTACLIQILYHCV